MTTDITEWHEMNRSTNARHSIGLHTRVIEGDRLALEQVVAELHGPLCHRLRRAFPRADTTDVADAATDAILTYVAQPHHFDEARMVPLGAFVYGIAARILRDRLRSHMRRSAREGRYAAHRMFVSWHQPQDVYGARAVLAHELRCALALVCNTSELAAMAAWLNDAPTAVVAGHLGAGDLDPQPRHREIQRFVKRITQRLKRHFRSTARGRGGPCRRRPGLTQSE
jgi:DNA-directed RNA polymerase specialized sigma24 family protein